MGRGPHKHVTPCPSVAAARRHQRAGEPLCPGCAVVFAEYQAANYRRRRKARTVQVGQ
jgi:hypothetical protein